MRIFYLFLFVSVLCCTVSSQNYFNVTSEQNISHSLFSGDQYGSGLSFFDFDNDGWDDITLLLENDSLLIYKNEFGVFHKYPSPIFNEGQIKQVLWVDYDNDYDNDLFLSTKNGVFRILQNDGNLSFTDVTQSIGISTPVGLNYGGAFGDYNKDGFLDLYICRYYMPSEDIPTLNDENILFKNNGDGTFTNVTIFAGVGDGLKPSFQPAFIDYDKDTWPDIYVINDRTDWGNAMFNNNGDGTFTDVAPLNGSEVKEQSPMSISVADVNQDGYLDIFMSNLGTSESPGMLLINNTDGSFTDLANQYGFNTNEFPSSWGAVFIDLENDGEMELYLTTVGLTRDYFYQIIDGVYMDDPSVFVGPHLANSFAVAKGDINNDGYADLMVQNSNGASSILWKNSGGANNFVKISLKGTVSNGMAIGSWINVYAGQQHYVKYTQCGENYLSQNSQHHIFGLGANTLVDSVVIEYPSGIIERFSNLEVNQHYYFKEGETFNNSISFVGNTTFCEGDSIILDAGDFESYLWSNGQQQRFITVSESGNYFVEVTNQQGLEIRSDTLSILVSNMPNISYEIENPLCFDQDNGSAVLVLEGEPEIFFIQWSNGAEGLEIENLEEGNYAFNYSDENGCAANGQIDLVAPYEIVLFAQIINANDSMNGAINLSINGGTAPYQILLNGVDVQENITNIPVGNYNLEIYDVNGCYYNFYFEIINETPNNLIQINGLNKLKIYPNPLNGSSVLNLESINGPLTGILSIIGIDGKKIFTETIENKNVNSYSLNVSSISTGMYFIEIITESDRFINKFSIDE